MKRNKKDRLGVLLAFTLLFSSCVNCATVDKSSGSNEKSPAVTTRDDGASSRQGRQLSPSHYDANRLKPLPAVATPRDASVNAYNNPSNNFDQYYNNYNNNAVHNNEPVQPQYTPTDAANAYYYYHYPDYMKAKLAYSGPHYGSSGVGDFANQKTSDGEYKFGSYIYNFIRDVLPPPEADSKTDPITLTGLASLVVSSLSGLSWVAIGALVLILAPVIIPLVLAPLLFLLLLLYFIPVIRLDIPATGRGMSILKHLDTTAHFYKRMVQNDECLERISCEIARFTQGNMFEHWISQKLENSSNKWLHRFSRSFKAAKDGQNCQIFSCNSKYHLKKSIGSSNFVD